MPAKLQHRGAHVGERQSAALPGAERAGQLAIAQRRGQRISREPERYAEHHESPGRRERGRRPGRRRAGGALEHAGPVAESAVSVGHVHDEAVRPVVGTHGHNGLGDLLTVGADVLDGSRSDEARYSGQAFSARQAVGDALLDQRVPVLARGGCHHDGVAVLQHADPAGQHPDHCAGKALVRHDQVAAAAEHQYRLAAVVRGPHGGQDLLVAVRLDEARSRPAKPERCVAGQRHLLTYCHGLGPSPRRTGRPPPAALPSSTSCPSTRRLAVRAGAPPREHG